MENQAGGFQGFLGSLFAVVISYIAPIYDYVIIIAYIFLINFILRHIIVMVKIDVVNLLLIVLNVLVGKKLNLLKN